MDNFTRKLLTEWRKLKLPFEGTNILIAVSGGADSCALALGLADLKVRRKLDNSFIIGHFNHNLRGEESGTDANFTEMLANDLRFDFLTEKAKKEQTFQIGNLEQESRRARYKFLLKAANEMNCSAILTAHTINDQAETFLLNLIRGSGIGGLCGMRTVQSLESLDKEIEERISNEDEATFNAIETMLVRPMLRWATSEDTKAFVGARGVKFRIDSMNSNEKFRRVKIRRKLIPQLREYNPKIVETLARTAQLLSEADENIRDVYREEIRIGKTLKVGHLKTMTSLRLRYILLRWLKKQRSGLRRIGFKHIEAIEKLVHSRKSGKIIELPGGGKVIKQSGVLIFRESEVEK